MSGVPENSGSNITVFQSVTLDVTDPNVECDRLMAIVNGLLHRWYG